MNDRRIFSSNLLSEFDEGSENSESSESERTQLRDSALVLGYAAGIIQMVGEKVSRRLKKLTVGVWRNRVLREQGLGMHNKYIQTQSHIKVRRKMVNFFAVFAKKYFIALTFALLSLKKYVKNNRKFKFFSIFYKIADRSARIKAESFYAIRKISSSRKIYTRYIKERILWTTLVLRNSQAYCVKKSFGLWEKFVIWERNSSRIKIHTQINRFKNFERNAMLKVFKAFSDSQAKKRCGCFLKWSENAKKLSSSAKVAKLKQASAKLESEKASELETFEKGLLSQKSRLIQNQIESLLYSLSIDTINAFINL